MNEYIQMTTVKRGFDEISPLFDIIKGNGFVGGSYAAYMAAPENSLIIPPNDIDVFGCSDLAVEHIHQLICDELDMRYYSWSLIARTYIPQPGSKIRRELQLINPHPDWREFPSDIITSFDFDVCRALLVSPTEIWADMSVGETNGKILRVNDPMKTLNRILKYHKRGVEFDNWELLKLLRAWDEYPRHKKEELIKANDPSRFDVDLSDDGEYEEEPYGGWYEEDDWFNGE